MVFWRQFIPLVAVVFLLVSAGQAQQWSRFRGPNGAGRSSLAVAPQPWTKDDIAWRVQLPGEGHSSPVAWNHLLVVTSADSTGGERFVLGLDADSGTVLWQWRDLATSFKRHKLNSLASSTPAMDDRQVYICWPAPDEFEIVALDHEGAERWRQNLGAYQVSHGGGGSPIVVDDLVIVAKEHEGDSEIVALNTADGSVRWRLPRESRSTWVTPCLRSSPQGTALIFTNWTHGISAVSLQGEILWEVDCFNKDHIEASIASPVLAGDLILGSSGWLAVRQEVVAVRPPDQEINLAPGTTRSAELVFTIDRNAPLCTTPLVVEDLLFLWSDQGIVTCCEAQNGQLLWKRRVGGTYYASPIAVGNQIHNISADGDVVVLEARREYALLARIPLSATSHSTPAVVGGRLIYRTLSEVVAVQPPLLAAAPFEVPSTGKK